jgi:dihydrolipoamide dehydrogenase
MLARKDAVVKQNNDGILYLFKKNKVTFFHGRGSFAKARRRATRSRSPAHGADDRRQACHRRHRLQPAALPGAAFDEETILSNDGALRIPSCRRRWA